MTTLISTLFYLYLQGSGNYFFREKNQSEFLYDKNGQLFRHRFFILSTFDLGGSKIIYNNYIIPLICTSPPHICP